ncbi:MAG: hypothetical protein QME66_08300 [Candidatus Eisenbacteria bacterium]|nr:hypothetical protein [Candidatus Eisenbacteria bacterium]
MAITRLPPFLPAEEDEKDILEFLKDELQAQERKRQRLHAKIADWEKQYESIHEGESNFPWPRSANPKTGLTQYVVDTVFSIQMNVLKANRLPFICDAKDRRLLPICKPSEEYLQWCADNDKDLNLWPSIEPAVLECLQIGTSLIKGVFEINEETVRLFRNVNFSKLWDNATKEMERAARGNGAISKAELMKGMGSKTLEMIERTVEVSATRLYHVPLVDFWFPLGYRELQHMPWVAERFRARSRRGVENYIEEHGWIKERTDKIKESWKSAGEERRELAEEDRATGTEEATEQVNTFFEVWFEWRFKVDPWTKRKTSKPKRRRWVLWFHPETETILGVLPHPYNNNIWPFFDFHCQRRKNKFLSRGFCAMFESEDSESNAIHKQRRDAATAANTILVKARKNSGLTTENTTIWPNKVFFMDDPEKDMMMEVIGRQLDIQSMINEEQLLQAQVERKSGISELNSGRDMSQIAKGRASATAFMAGLRENLRRFSKILDNFRSAVGGIGMHTLELAQQHAPLGKIFSILGPDGAPLERFFLLPQMPLRGRLFVKCSASTENMNEEIRRQAILLTNNMLTGYYKQMMELAGMMSNPNAPPEVKLLAGKIAEGMNVITEEFLEAFGIRRKNELLVELPPNLSSMSPEMATQIIKQQVNMLKAKGAPIELIDTREQGQPQTPAALPQSPVPLPPAPQQGAAPPQQSATTGPPQLPA